MKKITVIISVLIFTFFAVKAQEEKKANGPEIKFDKLVHDYGTILKDSEGNCEFKVTNTGNEPLIISTCRSSCGCTVPECPREPILPGQSDIILVKYTSNRSGVINKTITVISNAKNNPTVTLTLKGNVVDTLNEVLPKTQ